jgi:glycosyltransferase involved in cell wall biosynthesis
MPTVSVIVPNYNHARFLPRRIDSILAQTYQDFELILLDDCSTDESRSVLSGYATDPRVKIEFNEKNSGSTFKQWNKGARLATGKYIWIAESDDFADERLLERLVTILENDPSISFAYCRSWRVFDDDRIEGYADFYLDYMKTSRWTADFCVDGHEECRNYLVSSNTVPNASAVVFRRAAYERNGGADERLRLCGDWKLWVAMALEGKIAYLGEPLNYFRSHDASVRSKTRKDGLDVEEDIQVIGWVVDQVHPTDAVLERVLQSRVGNWVPAVMSVRVSLPIKLRILKNIKAIDPRMIRRALRPAIRNVWHKLTRCWDVARSALTPTRT